MHFNILINLKIQTGIYFSTGTLLAFVFFVPIQTYACTVTVSQGSEGSSVVCLQQLLTLTGDYTYGEITSYYGPATVAAVQKFQARKGIVFSGAPNTTGYGMAGLRTRLALLTEAVSVLQQKIKNLKGSQGNSGGGGGSDAGDDNNGGGGDHEPDPEPPTPQPPAPTELSIKLLSETDELVWEATDCKIADGPVQMWKNNLDETFAPISIPVNFALKSDVKGGAFEISPSQNPITTYNSTQSNIESHQDSKLWLMGFWTDNGKDVYSLAHQEWYHPSAYAKFVLNSTPPCAEGGGSPQHAWKASVHHLTSNNGGKTFSQTIPRDPSATSNSHRQVLVAEPFGDKPYPPSGQTRYGFFHPSNIVKEGDYYYFMVGVQENILDGATYIKPKRSGFMLARTTDISQPRAESMYQFWDGGTWTNINTFLAVGRPFIFTHLSSAHSEKLKSDKVADYFSMYALKYSTEHNQWIVFGYAPGTELAYFTTDTLASPDLSERKSVEGSLKKGPYQGFSWHATYPTLIDPESSGYVFQNVGETAYVYYIKGINQGKGRQIRRAEVIIE